MVQGLHGGRQEAPGLLELINVVARNLGQAGVLHAMLAAAIVVPLRDIISLSERR
jgi:hypothetical protein